MGLAAPQARLLTLISRKADCEFNISIDSKEKLSIASEMSELSSQYYAKLRSKSISYYSNGKYNKMTYQYLMGYGKYASNFGASSVDETLKGMQMPIKDDKSMILTDYRGLVVMNNLYRDALVSVLGSDCVDYAGRGKTFSQDNIPALIAKVSGLAAITAEDVEAVMNNNNITDEYGVTPYNAMIEEAAGDSYTKTTTVPTDKIQEIIDFYYPIFLAAASNGWTAEYNNEMAYNDDYISDALVSGSFQLQQVEDNGYYQPDASLTYFCMSGRIAENNDSSASAEITAWYNKEKERISKKESILDVEITDLSTELEAINTEIESVKSFINDNIQNVFDWGGS